MWLILIIIFLLNSKPTSAASPLSTKFGIFYSIWHCLATENIYDNEKILANKNSWGPLTAFHWWSEPDPGYYCPTTQPDVLKKHAKQLTEAKIDFVFVDITNFPNTNQGTAKKAAMDPFTQLLLVWSAIPNAPKIVPWVKYTSGGTMVDWIATKLLEYPNMTFNYLGKPLYLLVDDDSATQKSQELSSQFTVRKMWAFSKPQWSYMQVCADSSSFRTNKGSSTCNQSLSTTKEQLSISTAYQKDFISNKLTAVPKFNGKTFRRQFDVLFDNPGTPIVTITSWNEWIAQRFCYDDSFRLESSKCTHESFSDGSRVFVDQYNHEYSRDIEPSKTGKQDYYYQLMKSCISLYKSGNKCQNSPNSLCCNDFNDNWRQKIGDANLDSKIDILDFSIWKSEYLKTISTKKSDFNSDNKTDLSDFTIWKTSYLSN